MAWKPLLERLNGDANNLPLILAGPILRKVTKDSVTVWLALSDETIATLKVYEGTEEKMNGSSYGISLSNHLHIYCITASTEVVDPWNPGGPDLPSLKPDVNYHYDIEFVGHKPLSKLNLDLSYDDTEKPSFALPPSDIKNLRIIHGSCRKPHAAGRDALHAIDIMLDPRKGGKIVPKLRPHQLFLTGDQIYADDVADSMLHMITDAANILFGEKKETIDGLKIHPGLRTSNNDQLGFTSTHAKSHLFKFQEYCLLYLFSWSDVLWQKNGELPQYDFINPQKNSDGTPNFPFHTYPSQKEPNYIRTIQRDPTLYSNFKKENENLKSFKQTLPAIRKALANVPTYMMFDDHDVTDDWNLNWRWCKRLYSKTKGRKVVSNALASFALFQGMGNTPEQFESVNGKDLFSLVAKENRTDSEQKTFEEYLNIPTIAKNASQIIDFPQHPKSFQWHFNLSFDNYEIIMLDTRTMRNFPTKKDKDFCGLISKDGFGIQLPKKGTIDKEVVFIISPAPVLGAPIVEKIQKAVSVLGDFGRKAADAEAWEFNQPTYHRLFSHLAQMTKTTNEQAQGRFIFLSGDVHYGFSAKHELWSKRLFEGTATNSQNNEFTKNNFVQFTSSSLKNQAFPTLFLHLTGYYPTIPAVIPMAKVLKYGKQFALLIKSYEKKYKNPDNLPKPIEAYGWNGDKNNATKIGETTPPNNFPNRDYLVKGSPITLSKRFLKNISFSLKKDPEWIQKTSFILAEKEGIDLGSLEARIPLPTKLTDVVLDENKLGALAVYATLEAQHLLYARKWGNGKEIVGLNNIGEINIEMEGEKYIAVQKIWWELGLLEDTLTIAPLSTFKVPLYIENDNPKFEL